MLQFLTQIHWDKVCEIGFPAMFALYGGDKAVKISPLPHESIGGMILGAAKGLIRGIVVNAPALEQAAAQIDPAASPTIAVLQDLMVVLQQMRAQTGLQQQPKLPSTVSPAAIGPLPQPIAPSAIGAPGATTVQTQGLGQKPPQ